MNSSASNVLLRENFSVSIEAIELTRSEAEEAQAKIEELKDEEYNERRILLIN